MGTKTCGLPLLFNFEPHQNFGKPAPKTMSAEGAADLSSGRRHPVCGVLVLGHDQTSAAAALQRAGGPIWPHLSSGSAQKKKKKPLCVPLRLGPSTKSIKSRNWGSKWMLVLGVDPPFCSVTFQKEPLPQSLKAACGRRCGKI